MKTSNQIVQNKARIYPLPVKNSQKPFFNQRIFVHSKNSIDVLNPNDVIYIKANGGYSEFMLVNNRKIISSRTLKHHQEKISSAQFLRVHHGYLINTHFIEKVIRFPQMKVCLESEIQIPVSRKNQKILLNLFK